MTDGLLSEIAREMLEESFKILHGNTPHIPMTAAVSPV